MEEFRYEEKIINPWLARHELGLVKAILLSIWQIIFKPHTFFLVISEMHPIGDALKFYFTFIFTEIILMGALFAALNPGIAIQAVSALRLMAVMPLILALIIGALAVFVGISVGLLFTSALVHILVFILRGRGGYSGTFSVVSYASATQALFVFVVPIAFFMMRSLSASTGILFVLLLAYLLVVLIWSGVVQIIGYKQVHKIDYARAFFIFLTPVILSALVNFLPMAGYIKKLDAAGLIFKSLRPKAETKIEVKTIAPQRTGSIEWGYDLNLALKQAVDRKTLVVADFYTDWCGWCKKLDQDTYSNRDVMGLSKNFVLVKIDGDKQSALTGKYKVNGYPTILFLRPDGGEEKRVVGYVAPGPLIAVMDELIKKNNISSDVEPNATTPGAGAYLAGKAGGLLAGGLRLGGIVASKDGYKAVINEEFYKVGDAVGSYTVVDINKEAVSLQDKGGRKMVLHSQDM